MASEKLEVLTAFKQEPLETLRYESESEVMKKLEKAYQLFSNRDAWLPAYRRIEILEKTLALISERAEDLTFTAAKEGGKPYLDSKVEVDRGIEGIKIAIKEMFQLHGEEIPMNMTPSSANRLAFTIKEPRGVVFGVSAFNHPFNLIIHQVIPAIATGCPVLIKPATTTPLSCRSIVSILREAGLPEGWCEMVVCSNDVAQKIVMDERIAFMTFIGSARVGWFLRSKLAPGASCALEHGGVAPVIFDETADLEKNIPLLVKGGFYHAGQVCVSVQRVYVQDSILTKFSEQFVSQAEKLKVGDPVDKSTEVGPLILPREVDRVHDWVQESLEKGGKLLCGGKKLSDTCYAPTVILDPPEDVKVSQNEVFGPVVCLYSYKNRKEAIERANKLNVCFQAAVFSQNLDAALDTAKRLNGLAVMINDHTAFRVDWMPFGGAKQSGLGVGGIGHTMKDMTLEKLLVFRSSAL